jgi:hypothetical protein
LNNISFKKQKKVIKRKRERYKIKELGNKEIEKDVKDMVG